jgi:hypothetical protein
MRRILFTLLTVGALMAVIPAASLAHDGHHRGDRHREREHRHGHHRAQIRHEHFGGAVHRDVGVVTSFVDGRLTIRLNDNTSVSGAVNRFTEVECEMNDSMRSMDQGSGDSGSGGNGGPGSGDNDPGDDNGNDPGDDHGHDGPGHERGHDGGRDHDGNACTMIAPGTQVRDASLQVGRFGAVWTRVELDA